MQGSPHLNRGGVHVQGSAVAVSARYGHSPTVEMATGLLQTWEQHISYNPVVSKLCHRSVRLLLIRNQKHGTAVNQQASWSGATCDSWGLKILSPGTAANGIARSLLKAMEVNGLGLCLVT